MWKKLLRAARFAKKAHAGQTRMHGAPYYTHPMAVARMLWNQGHRDLDLLCAAYLHDTLEDTDTSSVALDDHFGSGVRRLVLSVTKHSGEPYEDYYNRVKTAGHAAMALKRADRAHNNSELHMAPASATTLRTKAARKTQLMNKVFDDNQS